MLEMLEMLQTVAAVWLFEIESGWMWYMYSLLLQFELKDICYAFHKLYLITPAKLGPNRVIVWLNHEFCKSSFYLTSFSVSIFWHLRVPTSQPSLRWKLACPAYIAFLSPKLFWILNWTRVQIIIWLEMQVTLDKNIRLWKSVPKGKVKVSSAHGYSLTGNFLWFTKDLMCSKSL